MLCATRGGDGWLWYAYRGGDLLFLGGPERVPGASRKRARPWLGIALFLALKREQDAQEAAVPIPAPHCWSRLLPPDQFSFPSGHTITAFAFTVAAATFYPSLVPC